MPELEANEQVCPYLRGRRQPAPVLTPSDDNHCVLAASIHLPHAQQSRYCLGGRYRSCSRFERQQDRPLPRYVVGLRPSPASAPVQAPERSTLLWRRPWFRQVVLWMVVAVFVVLVIAGWRWQDQRTEPRVTPRPPLPTAIVQPTGETTSDYNLPAVGPNQP